MIRAHYERLARHRHLFVLWYMLCALLGGCAEQSTSKQEDTPVLGSTAELTVGANYSVDFLSGSLNGATAFARAPDGRFFVCEQAGALRVYRNGALLGTPFVTLPTSANGERGLLGVAVDPAFATNGFVYVYYTTTSPTLHNRVSRFTASGDVAAAGSEQVIFDVDGLSSATNHNGGAIHFGSDGRLYIATGDNASSANSQTLTNTLGKILRINADGSIPTDNPFYASTSGNARAIWAYGLRNPFSFAFQPGTGRMFINDVGESTWEEINDGVAASNYGWPTTEGSTTDARFRSPLFAYAHGNSATTGCSITGGAFYNPQSAQFPGSLMGKYFFADYCSGWIRSFDPASGTASDFATGIGALDLLVSPDGYLYYLNRSWVARIGYSGGGQAPSISTEPQGVTVGVGQQATFSVAASGTQPLSYRWQRGSTDIPGASSSSYTLTAAAADNNATFRVIVTNGIGSVTSSSATLRVTTNAAPTASISSPASQAAFAAGDTINYVGVGSDAEDGTLPASAFSWLITLHHDAHVHPFLGPINGVSSGSFVVPRTGHTETNIFYRLALTVRDSAGLTTTTSVDIVPRLVNLTLQSVPTGLRLTLEGQPLTAPSTLASVVGVTRTLGVLTPQTLNGKTYQFTGWSDGGAATHDLNTPASNTTYTATFTETATNSGGLRAEYYDNRDFTNLVLTRTDASVDFNWGATSPAAGVGADTYSVRWTGTVTPRFTQAYTFYTQSDDGVRLWVNDVQVVDNWTDHGSTENRGTTAVLTAGQAYPIRMEFYENGGDAVARLSWSSSSQTKQVIPSSQLATSSVPPPPPPASGTGLKAEYFNNADLTAPVLTRTDATVDFDWGDGSPASAIGVDTFSVRWTGTVTPTFTESYRFFAGGDDGVRLWVNDTQVANAWVDSGYREVQSSAVPLTAGQTYPIRLEFYENGGKARATLAWSSARQTKQIIPASQLVPAP